MNNNTNDTDKSQELPLVISDAAWKRFLPFLQAHTSVYVGDEEDCRRFLSAVLWVAKEGASWRAIPKVYGYWKHYLS